MATLSKSKYTLSCQCQKASWLRTHKSDVATIDASVEARFAAGNKIGDMWGCEGVDGRSLRCRSGRALMVDEFLTV